MVSLWKGSPSDRGAFLAFLMRITRRESGISLMDFFDVFWSLDKYWKRGEQYGRKDQQLSFRCRKILS